MKRVELIKASLLFNIVLFTILFANINVVDAKHFNITEKKLLIASNFNYIQNEMFNISFSNVNQTAKITIVNLLSTITNNVSINIVEDEFGVFLRTYTFQPNDTDRITLPLNGLTYVVSLNFVHNGETKEIIRTFQVNSNTNLVKNNYDNFKVDYMSSSSTTYNNGPLGISTALHSEDALLLNNNSLAISEIYFQGGKWILEIQSQSNQRANVAFYDMTTGENRIMHYNFLTGDNIVQIDGMYNYKSVGVFTVFNTDVKVSKKVIGGVSY